MAAGKPIPNGNSFKGPVAPSEAAARPGAHAADDNATMLNVMNSRGPRMRSHSWAMTLCMGAGVVILILTLVQLVR